jgi:ABC-2 type transport system permease protein
MGREEIIATLIKEIKVVIRERRLLALLIMQPIILITVFGYAFSGEIKSIPVAVIDEDSSYISGI